MLLNLATKTKGATMLFVLRTRAGASPFANYRGMWEFRKITQTRD
jgi:hypothetical protein